MKKRNKIFIVASLMSLISIISLASCDFSLSKDNSKDTMTTFSPDMIDFNAIDREWIEPYIATASLPIITSFTIDPDAIPTELIPTYFPTTPIISEESSNNVRQEYIAAVAASYGFQPSSISTFSEFLTYIPNGFSAEIKENIYLDLGKFLLPCYSFYENPSIMQYLCIIDNDADMIGITFIPDSQDILISSLDGSNTVPYKYFNHLILTPTLYSPLSTAFETNYNSMYKYSNQILIDDNYTYSLQINGNTYINTGINRTYTYVEAINEIDNQLPNTDKVYEYDSSLLYNKFKYLATSITIKEDKIIIKFLGDKNLNLALNEVTYTLSDAYNYSKQISQNRYIFTYSEFTKYIFTNTPLTPSDKIYRIYNIDKNSITLITEQGNFYIDLNNFKENHDYFYEEAEDLCAEYGYILTKEDWNDTLSSAYLDNAIINSVAIRTNSGSSNVANEYYLIIETEYSSINKLINLDLMTKDTTYSKVLDILTNSYYVNEYAFDYDEFMNFFSDAYMVNDYKVTKIKNGEYRISIKYITEKGSLTTYTKDYIITDGS